MKAELREAIRKLERSHARLLSDMKYLSNDGKGCFYNWENGQGVSIQKRLERTIRNAEKVRASVALLNG